MGERDLAPQAQVPGRERHGARAHLVRSAGISARLEQAGEPAQRIRAARHQRGGQPQRAPGGAHLLARALHLGERVQARRLGRVGGGEQREQFLRALEVPPVAQQAGQGGRPVAAGEEPFGGLLLVGKAAVAPSQLVAQRSRVAAARVGPQRRFDAGARRGGVPLRVEQPGAGELQPRGHRGGG